MGDGGQGLPAQAIAMVAESREVLRHPEASERWLTDAERARAAAFVHDPDRTDFVAAHLLVRLCAGRLLDLPARAMTVVQRCPDCGASGHGKPSIEGRPEVTVSLSHTRGVVGAAAGSGPIGMDVEVLDQRRATPELLHWALTPAELKLITEHDDPDSAFLRQWVRKEALVKAGRARLDQSTALDLSGLPLVPADGLPRVSRFEELHVLDCVDERRGVMLSVVSDRPVVLAEFATGPGPAQRVLDLAHSPVNYSSSRTGCVGQGPVWPG
jgi:4'-phosphopantetheinyl transferase